jgi:hypothetical protein
MLELIDGKRETLMNFEGDAVVLVRDGQEITANMYVQGNKKAFAPYEINAREGDILRSDKLDEEKVIADVNKLRGPGGRMAHTEITLVSKKEWERMSKPHEPSSVSHTWNIGTAGAVAGHDIHNVNLIVQQFAQQIEEEIKNDKTIPEEKKRGILTRLGDLLLSPKVVEAAVTAIKAAAS